MSASCPTSARSTSVSTVASPQSRRWLPKTQRSPGRLTGSSGGSGTSLGALARRLAIGDREQPLELGGVEADQVEVEALVPQPGQLLSQQLLTPPRLQGELVVRDQIGSL